MWDFFLKIRVRHVPPRCFVGVLFTRAVRQRLSALSEVHPKGQSRAVGSSSHTQLMQCRIKGQNELEANGRDFVYLHQVATAAGCLRYSAQHQACQCVVLLTAGCIYCGSELQAWQQEGSLGVWLRCKVYCSFTLKASLTCSVSCRLGGLPHCKKRRVLVNADP